MEDFYKNMDEKFRDKLTQHEFEAEPSHWEAMDQLLNAHKAAHTTHKSSWKWTLMTVASVATILGLTVWGFYNLNDVLPLQEEQRKIVENSFQSEIKVEQQKEVNKNQDNLNVKENLISEASSGGKVIDTDVSNKEFMNSSRAPAPSGIINQNLNSSLKINRTAINLISKSVINITSETISVQSEALNRFKVKDLIAKGNQQKKQRTYNDIISIKTLSKGSNKEAIFVDSLILFLPKFDDLFSFGGQMAAVSRYSLIKPVEIISSSIGLFVNYKLTGNWSVQLEGNYKNYQFKDRADAILHQDILCKGPERIDFIEVPVLGKLMLSKIHHFLIGPRFIFPVNIATELGNEAPLALDLKKVGIGLSAGYEFSLTDNIALGLRCNLGITNLVKKQTEHTMPVYGMDSDNRVIVLNEKEPSVTEQKGLRLPGQLLASDMTASIVYKF